MLISVRLSSTWNRRRVTFFPIRKVRWNSGFDFLPEKDFFFLNSSIFHTPLQSSLWPFGLVHHCIHVNQLPSSFKRTLISSTYPTHTPTKLCSSPGKKKKKKKKKSNHTKTADQQIQHIEITIHLSKVS